MTLCTHRDWSSSKWPTLFSELFDQLSRLEQFFKSTDPEQIMRHAHSAGKKKKKKNMVTCQLVNCCQALMSSVNSFVFQILMPDYLHPGSRKGDESCNLYMPWVHCLSLSLAAHISVVLFLSFLSLTHTHWPVG